MKKIVLIGVLIVYVEVVISLPPGLANCGNTCFLNASLQVLYSHDALRGWLIANPLRFTRISNLTGYLLCNLFKEFQRQTNSGKSSYVFQCNGTLLELSKQTEQLFPTDSCGSQQDAQEFIGKLLDVVSTPNAQNDIGEIYKLYEHSQISCPLGAPVFKADESALILASIVDSETGQTISTLADILRQYFKAEQDVDFIIQGVPGGQKCIKKLSLLASPKCLFVSLKRYRYDGKTNVTTKLHSRAYIPLQLNIAPFLIGAASPDGCHYQLKGVAVQGGGTQGGHYWAYVRELPSEKWFLCNDSAVREVSFVDPQVLADIEGGSSSGGTGYFFVYEKVAITQQQFAKWQGIEKSFEEYARNGDFSFNRAAIKPLPPLKKRHSAQGLEKALGNLTQALNNLQKALKQ